MGARHRARPGSIQIMKVQVIPASKLKSKNLRQFVVSSCGFVAFKKTDLVFPLTCLVACLIAYQVYTVGQIKRLFLEVEFHC